jgi:hypothetical protein
MNKVKGARQEEGKRHKVRRRRKVQGKRFKVKEFFSSGL